MASLQARSPLRSAHPLFLLFNKFVSVTLFVTLLVAGWIGLNYLRAELQSQPLKQAPAASSAAPIVPASNQMAVSQKAPPARLVYVCQTDSSLFHASTHLERCKRTALSEDAALARGLKRCQVCLPD